MVKVAGGPLLALQEAEGANLIGTLPNSANRMGTPPNPESFLYLHRGIAERNTFFKGGKIHTETLIIYRLSSRKLTTQNDLDK